ncbi:NAD-dependent DNA ligase LigA [Clostridium botulinum]|uniref:NAD-dependent DNA ligase LigA n=1 Tax=Clostridium botulinum TaxID=1491 RepID=UPI000166BD65|nr:NAD-dependent DNA ligase LigA [Clostridium botulinum]EDS76628.1 DNA ligase, NAD-dependent [Clostridium botulinum C str. Eklund]KEH96455.1 putative NAD-dependent DNA ligase [Clostridium botulinum D str. 16868]KOA77338.1 DNA ligase [Clostridium botulinum]KOA90634.1 DNA ligase [Clostridium botulinum]KOC34949.1 DNA ligase [Clostridium botulinum]
MEDKTQRVKELIKELNEASDKYYNSDKTTMIDKEWDDKFDELKQLEQETEVILSNSPTQKVGYEVKSKLDKVVHNIPLKSLGKTKSIDDLQKFIGNNEILIMDKGDGLTCELIYDNGQLLQGSTRGNGEIGEDITHNVKTFKNIPLQIDFKGYLKLSGESVILDEDFELINAKLDEEDKYSNSRNLVAGSVRQLDSKICDKRNVRFYAFSLLECGEAEFKTKEEQLEFLSRLGFETIEYIKYDNSEELEQVISKMQKSAYEKGFPIDGLVFAYNNIEYANSLGDTLHHPLHSIAYKFYDEEYETKYIATEWQVSRTGMINPVARFEPVEIEGSVVERATLHNLDYFEDLKLGQGDTIKVIKANQVIPKVMSNDTMSNTEIIPTECPVCGGKTEEKLLKTARVLICINPECSAKHISRIVHYCSRNAMNIDGLSEKTIEKFVNLGYLKDIDDIYKLEQYKEEIINIDGFGTKSYNNMIEAIEKSKHCKLENFIFALGVPSVGLGTAKLLVKKFKSIEKVMNCNLEEIYSIDGIGDVVGNEIYNYFIINKDSINLVNKLLKFIDFEEVKESSSNKLEGKTFVITGDVHVFKNRNEVKAKIEEMGGKVTGSVSKKTDYLINNDVESTSSKNQKAKDLNIPIITEEEFVEMIK